VEIGLSTHKTKIDKIQSETEKVEQYLYSFAKEFGFENLIEFDEDLKINFPTAEMEENFHGLIDHYDQKEK
jgi:hypothetical protein